MTNFEDQLRSTAGAYARSVEPPPLEAIVARAGRMPRHSVTPYRRRKIRRWTIAGVLAVVVLTPPAAAMVVHRSPDPLAGLNPDSKTEPLTSQLPRVSAGVQRVAGGYVTLTVVPGTIDGRSCSSIAFSPSVSGAATQIVTSCGGGDRATYTDNFFGASITYSDDPGVASVRVTAGGLTFSRMLHARYCLGPQLPDRPATITTYDKGGRVIATHNWTPPPLPPSSLP